MTSNTDDTSDTTDETTEAPLSPTARRKRLLKRSVLYFYDLQKLRIMAGNRANKMVPETELTEEDKKFLAHMSDGLEGLEKDAFKEVKRILKGMPIYEGWFKDRPAQKGCGPTMAGLIISHINIENCDTASKLWRFCGLAVMDGKAERRTKGEKAHYDPWLKSKVLQVLGECLIKANSPWRKFYDDYKHRKQHQLVEVCMGCEGKGEVALREDEATGKNGKKLRTKKTKCKNCDGKGGLAPWGASDAHRHQASMRYMVKMFLLEMWKQWRTLEGLEVRVPYAEEYLNRQHHAPGQSGQSSQGSEPFRVGQPFPQSEPSRGGHPMAPSAPIIDREVEAELMQEA